MHRAGAVAGSVVFLIVAPGVLAVEEPDLHAKFGAEYRAFCAHVRRWIPRFKPWRAPA
jgi:protein-S-isoprenylcysteine O-methyltransferase Ste14